MWDVVRLPRLSPAQILCMAAFSVLAFFFVDNWLRWFDFQFLQAQWYETAAFLTALTLIPALVAWGFVRPDWDIVTRISIAVGCLIGGALLGLYSLYTPAGTLVWAMLILMVAIGLSRRVALEDEYRLALVTTAIMFAAASILFSGTVDASVVPQARHVDTATVYHQVDLHQPYREPITRWFMCNAAGMNCMPVRNLQSLPAVLLPGGTNEASIREATDPSTPFENP